MLTPSEDHVTQLLDQILQLPKPQRAELADKILRSLASASVEADASPDWHTQWTDELDRRRREVADCARSVLGLKR